MKTIPLHGMLAAVGSLVLTFGVTAIPDNSMNYGSCVGVAVNLDPTDDYWWIECLGACTWPSTTTCKRETGIDPSYGTYIYCPHCFDESEGTCCHIVVEYGGGAYHPRGHCKPVVSSAWCDSGDCGVVAAPDDTDGTRKVAECF